MTRPASPRNRPPLDAAALERLALHYLGRFATTRAKLRDYLVRKLRDRGWEGEEAPPLDALVERMAGLGYVDDGAFAVARTASLARRGYGERRQRDALRAAGVTGDDLAAADSDEDTRWQAAVTFARRKRIGPYADRAPNPDERRRQFAAMMRAGHGFEEVRRILDSEIECPKEDR